MPQNYALEVEGKLKRLSAKDYLFACQFITLITGSPMFWAELKEIAYDENGAPNLEKARTLVARWINHEN